MGEVRICYCPTEEMIVDFFTKALQGSLFQCHSSIIMNFDPSAKQASNPRSVLGQTDCEGGNQTDFPAKDKSEDQVQLEKISSLNDVGGADIRNSKGLFKSRTKDCS